jgi:Ni/Co efflux regulator RcnB
VRGAAITFLNKTESNMISKTVISAIVAVSMATGGFAYAQGNRDRDDRGRNEHDQRGQQDHRQNQSQANDRRGERGAGPNHAFYKGGRLPAEYHNRHYVVDDWRGHHLSAPPRGYHWVQTGGDYVLVAIATGIILQLLLNN